MILDKDLFIELNEVYDELGHLVFENEKHVIVYVKDLGGDIDTSEYNVKAKIGNIHCEFMKMEDGYIYLSTISVEQNDKKLIISNVE